MDERSRRRAGKTIEIDDLPPLMAGATQATLAESLPHQESEFRRRLRRSVNLLMIDNELSPKA